MWPIQVSTIIVIILRVINTYNHRGQTKMMDVIINEINTWPDVVQEAIGYIQTSAVIIPLIILLWCVLYKHVHKYASCLVII